MNANVQPHVFLSYTRRDAEIMHRVRDTLRDEGLNVWIDEGIEPGTPLWDRAVEDGLKTAGCMLVILTPNVMDSKGVRDEIHFAGMHRVRIFTVLAQGEPSTAIPYTLSGNQWVDIRTSYATNMARLIIAMEKHIGLVPDVQEAAKLETPAKDAVELSNAPVESIPSVLPAIKSAPVKAIPKQSLMSIVVQWLKYLLAVGLEIFGGAILGAICGIMALDRYLAVANNDTTHYYGLFETNLFYTVILIIVAAVIFPIIRKLLLRAGLKVIWIYAFAALPALVFALIWNERNRLESIIFVTVTLLLALYILPTLFSNFPAIFRGLRRLFVRG